MADDKPEPGTEAQLIARVRAMAEEIRKLRRDFKATLHPSRKRHDRPETPEKRKSRKKR